MIPRKVIIEVELTDVDTDVIDIWEQIRDAIPASVKGGNVTAWLDPEEYLAPTRADERERLRQWSANCRECGTTHSYDDYTGDRREHQRTTGMAPAHGYMCACGRWVDRLQDWHNHLTGAGETQSDP